MSKSNRAAPRDPDSVFTKRIAIGIVVSCTISFLFFLFGLTFEAEDRSATAAPSAHSSSALGHRALIDFLRASGLNVRINHNRNTLHADEETAVLVAEPMLAGGAQSEKGAKQSFSDLYHRVNNRKGAVIVVLPKWTGHESKQAQGKWISRAKLRPVGDCERSENNLAGTPANSLKINRISSKEPTSVPCNTTWKSGLSFDTFSPQFISATRLLRPLASTASGILIAQCVDRRGDSTGMYVISDPDLLNNHGLARADHAELLLRFLTQELKVKKVVIDEIGHGFYRESSFMSELMQFPMILLLGHGLLVFGLVAWMGAIRFGKSIPLPPRLPSGKAGLIENTATLLSHRGRFLSSVQRYYDDVIKDVGQRYHRRQGQSQQELVASLQQISKQKGIAIDLNDLRAEIDSRKSTGLRSVMGLLSAANTLYRWRQEMLHGR